MAEEGYKCLKLERGRKFLKVTAGSHVWYINQPINPCSEALDPLIECYKRGRGNLKLPIHKY